MYTNIYKIAKHNAHELKIFVSEDEVTLGCITCGELLFSNKDVNYKEISEIHDLCKEALYFDMCDKIRQFVKVCLDLYCKEIAYRNVNKSKRDLIGTCSHHSAVLEIKPDGILSIFCRDFDASSLFEGIIASSWFKHAIWLKHKEVSNERKMFEVLPLGKEVTVSNCRCTCKDDTFFVVNTELRDSAEEDAPTVTDTKLVESVTEFIKSMPDYENEEEDDDEFREFVYRIEEDLFDFSDLSDEELKKILDYSLKYLFEYEYITRHSIVIKKMLNIMLGMYEGDIK